MTTALVEIPSFVAPELVAHLTEKITAAGYTRADAAKYAQASLPSVLDVIQKAVDDRASSLRDGEEFTISWDRLIRESTVTVENPQAAAMALLTILKAGTKTTPAPVAAKASGGFSDSQLAQLASIVAQAAAQGAAAGASVKQDGTLEVESQDIPVPGQLGRFKKRITTRRISNTTLPDLRG